MALGSKASEERRRKRREQQKLEQQRDMNEVDRAFTNAMAMHTPTEHDRIIFKIDAYRYMARLAGEPIEFAKRNVLRLAEGKEPLPYRVAKYPRSQIRGARGGLRADHEPLTFPTTFKPDDDLL